MPVSYLSHPAMLVPLTALMSLLFTGLAARYAHHRGMLDQPGGRHSHVIATPRGGGAGLVTALVVASIVGYSQVINPIWYYAILPGFVLIVLIGWWDDLVSLSAPLRLSVQAAVSLYLLMCLHYHGWAPGWLTWVCAGIFIVAMTNLYNFMDGSNGMAGTQGVFAGLVLAGLFNDAGDRQMALLCLLMAASCGGFLPWNLGQARVFMGDVGSAALGFFFAAILVYGLSAENFGLAAAWLVMLVFICDGGLTLLSRVIRGEQWYTAHRQHLYQRLITRGWPHGRVVLLYQAINLVIVVPAIAVAVNYPAFSMVAALLATGVLVWAWLLGTKKLECSL